MSKSSPDTMKMAAKPCTKGPRGMGSTEDLAGLFSKEKMLSLSP